VSLEACPWGYSLPHLPFPLSVFLSVVLSHTTRYSTLPQAHSNGGNQPKTDTFETMSLNRSFLLVVASLRYLVTAIRKSNRNLV
jgi:hypothetical protein